ncbi:N-acetylmuramoyl-L-alanine amidase [Streptomyces sp. NPDC050418]|uniref:N-acetylmuramoyl-L-alanine amidase n=1 Tax=Streptomyces sp. NPDC050418 TaxID=3365612 RepID=UPI0037A1C393
MGQDKTTGGKGGDKGVPRRGLLVAAGTAVAAGVTALAFRDELGRLWWQIPGVDKQRTEGDVDQPGARWVAASAANLRLADRPADYEIDRIVIHVTEGSYATAIRVFRDPGHAAAAHYVIRAKDGEITQMARELDVAFHAGNRSYNEHSVGIEHEGFVDRPASFTKVMYEASARLAADICARYDIPIDRKHIVGHNEVPGATHTDPGPHWDWDRYMELVKRAANRPKSKETTAAAR